VNYKISHEAIEAARSLLAEGNRDAQVTQVHSVTLHDVDYNADPDSYVLTLIPIGSVMGFVRHKQDEVPKDEDIFFVSSTALAKAIVAMGYTFAASTQTWIVPPENPGPESVREIARRMKANIEPETLKALIELLVDK
jgi:hypothetical protein